MVRGLGTAVMHGTTVAMLAAIAHEFAERTRGQRARQTFNPLWFVPGYLLASRSTTVQPVPRPADAGDDRHDGRWRRSC